MQSLYISGPVIMFSLFSGGSVLAASGMSVNDKLTFNAGFMQGSEIDLNKFLAQGAILPGNYRVDLFLNQQLVARERITFVQDGDDVTPCLPSELLLRIGVDMPKLAKTLGVQGEAWSTCIDPRNIEYGNWQYDGGNQRLDISLPLALVPKMARDEVSPALWDQGIMAAFVNYRLSSHWNQQGGRGISERHNGSFTSGINVGPWRLRNHGSASYSDGQLTWRSEQSYAERDITRWSSQLALGEVYAESQLLSAPRLRGLTLGTDEQMLPAHMRGYVPVISGVAQTNATVEIRQAGEVLLRTTVPPGPFTLRDIPTRGSNGELEITIIEADGSQRTQTQGFGMDAIMVPKGATRYRLNLGELDDAELLGDRWFGSGEVIHGVASNVTLGAGMQGKKDYFALNMAVGLGTSFGAMSFDVTHSDSLAHHGEHVRGQSYRARFSRQFMETGTTVGVTAMRYSDKNYRTLNDHIADSREQAQEQSSRSKAQLSAAISQSLPDRYGSLNLSFNYDEFWGGEKSRTSLAAGYSNSWQRLSYNVNVEKSRANNGNDDTRLSVNLSMPLQWGGARNWLSIGSSHTGDNSYSNMGIGGSYEQFSYGLRANTDHSDNQSWSASGSGRGRYGDGSLGYSLGKNYRALHASWNGSLVAHAGGINLAPSFTDGFILAEVDGTEGVGFTGQSVKTGNNGYAVLSTFTPYKRNWVKIDGKTLPDDVEIDGNDSQVVPRKGAITKVVFPARKVIRAQFELRSASGEILPFGTQLESQDGELLAMSDPHGRALALLNKPTGSLVIKGDKMQCVVPYSLPSTLASGQSYHQAVLQCSRYDEINTDKIGN